MRSQKSKRLKLTEFFLERVLSSFWWICWPFHLLTRLIYLAEIFVWLMSNEYTKHCLGQCGRHVRIHGRIRIISPKKITIGNNVHINSNAYIRADGGLSIGDNTHISRNLTLYTVNHDYTGSRLPYDEQLIHKPVTIGRNVWIGMNVTIAPGVTIGDGAIVGLGTVVARDVAPLTIVCNAPLRDLKKRDSRHYDELEAAQSYGGMSGHALPRCNDADKQ